jgi:hypothetical protein
MADAFPGVFIYAMTKLTPFRKAVLMALVAVWYVHFVAAQVSQIPAAGSGSGTQGPAGASGSTGATGGTGASAPHSATSVSTPANPTGTTNTTGSGVMMGLSGSFTPVNSGNFIITITGDMQNSTTGDAAKAQARYGTGTAPTNAAALTGTACGSQPNSMATGAPHIFPLTLTCLVTGATVNTAYWIDASVVAVTGGTASIADLTITAFELP